MIVKEREYCPAGAVLRERALAWGYTAGMYADVDPQRFAAMLRVAGVFRDAADALHRKIGGKYG